MKLTFLAIGLAAITTVNAATDDCTNGVVNPDDGPCSYTVTCSSHGQTSSTPLQKAPASSMNDCLSSCTAYSLDNGVQCQSVDYKKKQQMCTLYGSSSFTKTGRTRMWDSAVLYGCG